jgi:hypothetical protein
MESVVTAFGLMTPTSAARIRGAADVGRVVGEKWLGWQLARWTEMVRKA